MTEHAVDHLKEDLCLKLILQMSVSISAVETQTLQLLVLYNVQLSPVILTCRVR